MNNLNPALASAVQTNYLQANGQANATANEPKISDKTTAEASSGGNTTVTLEDQSQTSAIDYTDLASSQIVSGRQSVESNSSEANETNNGLTYSSNLQAQANYLSNQNEE